MFLATVLGSGASPGHVLHARRNTRRHDAQSPSFPLNTATGTSTTTSPKVHFAKPRSLHRRPTRTKAPQRHQDPGHYAEEALTREGREVIWTRGIEVVRRFTFERDGQDVTSAVFAWFKINDGGQLQEKPTQAAASSSSTSDATYGPFHTSQTAEWGALRPTSRPCPAGLTRAVVVVLETRAHVFLVTGECVRVSVPFPLDGCWALTSGGLLVSRALGATRRQGRQSNLFPRLSIDSSMGDRSAVDSIDLRFEEEAVKDLPRLFTLTQLFGEFERVAEAHIDGGIGGDPAALRLFPSLSPPSFVKPCITILHVAPEPYPFVVAWDSHVGEVVVYRQARVPVTADKFEDLQKSPETRYLRPDQLMRQTEAQPAAVPSTRRGRASLGRGERRVSGTAPDPLDRTRRRASRLSAAHELPVLEEGDPFNEVDPFHEAAAKTSRSATTSVDNGRRSSVLGGGSIMREELHDYGKVLGVVAEDLRETTMVMGLDQDESPRSELVLEQLWSWRPLAPVTDVATIQAFLTDNTSPQSVRLHLFFGKLQLLATFHVQLSSSSQQYQFSKASTLSCIAAFPILSTRRDVFDLVCLDTKGDLHVWCASSALEMDVAIPNVTAEDGRDEVANQFASSLSMALDGNGAAVSHARTIVGLADANGSCVSVVYSDGAQVRVSLDCTPPPGIVARTLESLSYTLSNDLFGYLFRTYLLEVNRLPTHERRDRSKLWRLLSRILLDEFGLTPTVNNDGWSDSIMRQLALRVKRSNSGGNDNRSSPEPSLDSLTRATNMPKVLVALHLLAQDCRLSSTTESDLPLLAALIIPLAATIGRQDWVDYWTRLVPKVATGTALPPGIDIDSTLLDVFDEPPDILVYLALQLAAKARLPFPTPSSISSLDSPLGSPCPCKQTELLTAAYSSISEHKIPCERRAVALVNFMVDNGLDTDWVMDLPFGVGMPIVELIRVCQQNPPENASPEVYKLIRREELATLSELNSSILDLPMGAEDSSDGDLTIGEVMDSMHSLGGKHAHYSALPHVRFGLDRRLDEVERIMQTTRPRAVALDDPEGLNEQEIQLHYQNYANMLACRTFAITVGQGMFLFGSRSTTITGKWHIQPIDLAVKIVPANQQLLPQLSEGAEWPNFHHGVSAALSIASDSSGIDASWIMSNKPDVLNAEYAGFLLGLGLTGHLRKMRSGDAFAFLAQRHEKTSIGTMLGLASSFAGSRDGTVTRLLSLHTHALLPAGAMDLNASPLVQGTALTSLGLMYAGSRNLRIAEATLSEISRSDMPGASGFAEYREAYSFSAAMGFGLVMLGRGGQATSGVERRMLEQLHRCIYGDAVGVGPKRGPAIDATVTSPGATLALGLMYLRTGRKDIADSIEIPQSAIELESVRPDQLLIRVFARALIMWDDIKGTMEWVSEQVPQFIHHNDHKPMGMELNTELAYFNTVAGACLAIGLRFASSPHESAHSVIITLFSVLAKAAAGQSMAYEARIRRNAARQALNTVTLALAALMSGTGELGIMRRLRVSHGQEGVGVTYGSHMAMHMALGLLFLGKGYFSLGNSNLAIAALSIAFFPRFLAGSSDNKAYPQCYRHLWALAIEPRCLIARDVDTRESIFLPIKVKVAGRASQSHISPTPLPPFNTIESIVVDSPRYWPIKCDLSNPRDLEHLVRTRTIWVKRRSAFLDYKTDPRGFRSLFVRTGITSSYDMHYDLLSAAAPLALAVDEVIELIKSHSNDVANVAVAKRFTGSTQLEAFVRNALFECVALDKPLLLPVYLAVVLGLDADDDLALERVAQVAFLLRFYQSNLFDRAFASQVESEKRHPILRQSFLQTLGRRMAIATDASEYFCGGPADEATAAYLASNNVPPVKILQALRQLVGSLNVELGGVDQEIVEMKMREVADRYYSAAMGKWVAGPVKPPQWKLESVRDALRAWTQQR